MGEKQGGKKNLRGDIKGGSDKLRKKQENQLLKKKKKASMDKDDGNGKKKTTKNRQQNKAGPEGPHKGEGSTERKPNDNRIKKHGERARGWMSENQAKRKGW